ncbi:probable peptidoglycan muropeptide transporter SLC46 isoform X2 [Halyomorpha halys]|nr:solute carrier family 46 member 3 isoform X2 [Halyomorpha halys]XP_014292822.1 solute carrier family 46 member 3 isoform X2 [Halyomorpha halys]XP_014292823.1 solute carrier family 46 member 3 isoform X2 [Halyomorpha halys]XP_014292824.1 solute carrier family 46 member 3 isoform X2 [Halyomorpha halys]
MVREDDEYKIRHRFPVIGVEPVMFLYMAAFMTTTVVEEQFFVYKACSVNLGYPKNICHHINEKIYTNYSTQVQIEVSKFHQYENIASHAVPVILAFILGSWSDRVGRKLPMLLGLLGCLIYSFMIYINALFETWPVEMILFTASFPSALTGSHLTVFMSCFTYLSDTTTSEQRTVRTTLLEVAYLIPMPLGVAFGSYLFNGPLYRSFGGMFLVNSLFLFIAIVYTFLVIPWRTRESLEGEYNACTLKHFSNTLKTLVTKRKEGRRLLLILCLLGLGLFTLQRDEKRMMQLYSQWKFHWNVKQFSSFRTFQSVFFIIGLLVGIPLLQRYLKLRDTFIMMIGSLSHITARIIFMVFKNPTWYYIGAVITTFGPVVAPVLRSMTSKLVPPSERGKAFALLSVCDTTVPLVSGFIFSQVYINTIKSSFPEAIFLVTAASQFLVLLITIFMNSRLKGKNIAEAKENTEERAALH